MPGYSMPPATPASAMAFGHGYSTPVYFEKNSTVYFTPCVESCQPSFAMLSTGYADCAIACLPLGRSMRAASHTNAADAPNATSRVSCILKCHVSVPPCLGRLAGSVTSSAERITTVLSEWRACSYRCSSVLVSTSPGSPSAPEPTTSTCHGTVML